MLHGSNTSECIEMLIPMLHWLVIHNELLLLLLLLSLSLLLFSLLLKFWCTEKVIAN